MCLNVTHQKFDPPNNKQIIGYKIFSFEDGKYKTAYVRDMISVASNTEFNNDWKNDSFDCELGYKNKYRTGFHIFTSLDDAKNVLNALSIVKRKKYNIEYVVKPVECSDIVAIGTQDFQILKPHLEEGDFRAEVITIHAEVIVARKIKII